MRIARFVTWWARYLIALALLGPIVVLMLVLGAAAKIGDFCGACVDQIGSLDLFPDPRGKACAACRGRGRITAPSQDGDA